MCTVETRTHRYSSKCQSFLRALLLGYKQTKKNDLNGPRSPAFSFLVPLLPSFLSCISPTAMAILASAAHSPLPLTADDNDSLALSVLIPDCFAVYLFYLLLLPTMFQRSTALFHPVLLCVPIDWTGGGLARLRWPTTEGHKRQTFRISAVVIFFSFVTVLMSSGI